MTKREYPIDCMEELKIVRAKYNDRDKDNRAIRPHFFAHVAKKKGFYDSKKKNYLSQMAPMDYLQDVVKGSAGRGGRGPKDDKVLYTIGDIIKNMPIYESPRRGYIDLVIAMIKEMDLNTRMLYQIRDNVVADKTEKHRLAGEYFNKCIDCIRNLELNSATIRELLIEADNPDNSSIRRRLWTIVFSSLGKELSDFFTEVSTPVYTLEECKKNDQYDYLIYNIPFKKKLVA